MNRMKKTIAGLLALIISAASVGTVSAEAYGILDAPNSQLEYELTSRILSDTRIEVAIRVTNNPGFNAIDFTLTYSENCVPVSVTCLNENFARASALNANQRFIFCGTESITGEDESGDFVLRYWFNVDNAETDVYAFSSAVVKYRSTTENISFDKQIYGDSSLYSYEDPVGATWTGEGIEYMVGDMDNDRIIEISDANDVYSMARICNINDINRVDRLNNYILYDIVEPVDWKALFPNLKCANTADANNNGTIESADGDVIMNYYAEKGASFDVSDYYVGHEDMIKTLTLTPLN